MFFYHKDRREGTKEIVLFPLVNLELKKNHGYDQFLVKKLPAAQFALIGRFGLSCLTVSKP